MDWKGRAAVFAAALWWGSLTALGAVFVPLLFQHMPSPADAGRLAARLFAAQTWVSLGCGMFLLMAIRACGRTAGLGLVSAGMLLALLVEFAVAPRILARQDLAFWHSLGTAMFLAQWACAGAVLWTVSRPAVTPPVS